MVVDACQLRSDAENIVEYAGLGFLTLVTGSKFYCGPPFSGAVLFPPAALAELETGLEYLPAGFEDYFTRHEVLIAVRLALSPEHPLSSTMNYYAVRIRVVLEHDLGISLTLPCASQTNMLSCWFTNARSYIRL